MSFVGEDFDSCQELIECVWEYVEQMRWWVLDPHELMKHCAFIRELLFLERKRSAPSRLRTSPATQDAPIQAISPPSQLLELHYRDSGSHGDPLDAPESFDAEHSTQSNATGATGAVVSAGATGSIGATSAQNTSTSPSSTPPRGNTNLPEEASNSTSIASLALPHAQMTAQLNNDTQQVSHDQIPTRPLRNISDAIQTLLSEYIIITNVERGQLCERECTVCRDGERDVVLLPCGHSAVCRLCAGKLHECPICRRAIRGCVWA